MKIEYCKIAEIITLGPKSVVQDKGCITLVVQNQNGVIFTLVSDQLCSSFLFGWGDNDWNMGMVDHIRADAAKQSLANDIESS